MSEKLNQEIGKMTNGVFFQKLARVQSELNAPKDKKIALVDTIIEM